ncbi:ubiquitin-specific protease [Reticulomyxa filosa]|uniref:Ubiquitin-specific protease n=1 Tax=Reticulomyxa filosa TaxID=46433 RepID=X6LG53_RETFI|nr:ubiquitin-specific protease [Reticulomyxa filosa]|eukprot:ETO00341.1 ubiquitin-specific protease [Reticulomyxa filosa]
MITVYVFKDVDDAYSPVMVEVLASSKICVLKHRLKEILKNTEEDNLCLGYVNVSNKLSELVTVVDDQEDVSSYIFKKRGFFYADQVVDMQQCPNYLEEEKTDQFVIFPVLQCIEDHQYYRINFCRVPKKSQYKSIEFVNYFRSFNTDRRSAYVAALLQGDKYINDAGDWWIGFDKSLSLTIVFYQHQFQYHQQVGNIYFSNFLIFVMVYKLLKYKPRSRSRDVVSFCLCICNWILMLINLMSSCCSREFGNAVDAEESKLVEDQPYNNRVEVQEQITCEVEYSKINYHVSRILNETIGVPSIFFFFFINWRAWIFLKKLLVLKKGMCRWLQKLIPRNKFGAIEFKSIKESLIEMSLKNYVDGSQSFLKCGCSDTLKDNRIITQKKMILVAPQVLVVQINRIHPIFGYTPSLIDYSEDFKLAEKQYSLTGVCIHVGNTNKHGHYYAFVKNMHNGKWFRCNDADVCIMQDTPSPGRGATVLIYQFGQW